MYGRRCLYSEASVLAYELGLLKPVKTLPSAGREGRVADLRRADQFFGAKS
jgi:hypothetical protein